METDAEFYAIVSLSYAKGEPETIEKMEQRWVQAHPVTEGSVVHHQNGTRAIVLRVLEYHVMVWTDHCRQELWAHVLVQEYQP